MELIKESQQKELEALRNNTCVTGRQILHMLFSWLKTGQHMSQVFGFVDLIDIAWLGDMGRRYAEVPHVLGPRAG